MRPAVTLSSPSHPAMAEMAAALREEVDFHVVGPTVQTGSPAVSPSGSMLKLAYRMAVQARRVAPGAIAYQRMRSRILLKSSPRDRLVHCCSHLAYNDAPWIGDYENANVLGFYSPALLSNRAFVAHMRRRFRQSSCKAIRVWSDSAARSFQALFRDQEIDRKIRVIYPAIEIPACSLETRNSSGPPRILFVGRGFWVKGGALFLEAVRRLGVNLDFEVDFICDLPAECEWYRSALQRRVTFHEPRYSRTELFSRFYRNADIFVMLGMADSYGIALLEASSFGLPIIALRLHSGLSDLLRLTENSIQVDPERQIFSESGLHCIEPDDLVRKIRVQRDDGVVDQVTRALGELITNPALRSHLGQRGQAAVRNGPLSRSRMRREVLDLYYAALNDAIEA